MKSKIKGSNAERELIHLFHRYNWSACRIAGSGSSHYPNPDIIAGNVIRKIAIECKVTKEDKKYFSNADIDQLCTFAKNFGAEPWLAVKFKSSQWYFFVPEDLDKTAGSFVASVELAERKGLLFEQLIG